MRTLPQAFFSVLIGSAVLFFYVFCMGLIFSFAMAFSDFILNYAKTFLGS